MKYRTSAGPLLPLAALAAALAGCSAHTDVSLTGNTPPQFSHLFVTTQDVWFNTSGTASPDDGGWQKFHFSSPSTVDLVADEGGSLGSIASGLNLLAGTYSQVRIIPIDPSSALTTSAQSAGALYNAEADYVDASGNTHQLPLELLNPDKGISIQTSLKAPIGTLGGSSSASGTSGVFGAIGSGDAGSNAGTNDATGGVTTAGTAGTTTSTSTSGTTTTASFAINIDGARDLVPFSFGASAAPAVLLSSHASAYDLANSAGIQGTLTLTNLTGYTSVSGLPDIQVSAEVLSADGTRHEVVLSTPVHADGTFLLYPLATSSSTPAYYDVVIHGGGIATIIIKNVQLTLGTSSTTLSTATTTNTSTSSTTPTLNTVSVGTLTPRAAATFTANVTPVTGSTLPADALIGFYQTLASSGEVPYLIESTPVDPFNQLLFNAQVLSAGTVDSGTYVASGDTITVVSAAPKQGAGKYVVAASAPNYTAGPLTPIVSAPATSSTSTTAPSPVSVSVPGLGLASGATTGSLLAQITPATAGKYDQGELLVSHDGTLAGWVALDAVLASGGTVSAIVPAGTSSSLYYVSVRVWSSRNPSGTLSRQWFPAAVDLRSATSGSVSLTID